jgi:predicted membrane-bound spermidine synthase
VKKSTQPGPPNLSKGLRRYLYLTAAVTGAAIMVVEILGAKMLSPYVGLSHFVWTAQIAVTLVALACGYYMGGRWADRSQNLNRLYVAILAAAGYLVLTVLFCEPVAFRGLDFNLAVGSLLASAILFFVPLALLAMTGPFLIRVLTSTVAGLGGNVGRLTAVGTLGSFAGTLCIGYLMLPLLANSTSMYLTAAALTLVCGGYYACFHRSSGATLAATAMLATAIGWLALHPPENKPAFAIERFRGNSCFGQIQVLDHLNGRYRVFANDFLTQNSYDPVSKQSVSVFTYLLAGLARAYTTNIQDVLCIGMGVGIVPRDFAQEGARVDVVEINPAIEPVAVRFFDLEAEKLQITVDDGRHFLNRCRKQYDVVVLDAFLGDASPSHLMTREAFAAMRRVLRPGGVLVINAFCHLDTGHDFFASSLSLTLKSVFAGVRVHYSSGQVFVVAMDSPDPKFVRRPQLKAVHPAILSEVKAAFANVIELPSDSGRVLTDNFNPVEFYDARNRELVRRQLAMQARQW